MKLLIIFLTVFYGSYIVSSNPQKSCSCSEHLETDHRGQQIGKCKTRFGGKSWCYIPSNSNCGDKKKSKRGSSLFWSHIACQFKPSPSQQENFVLIGGYHENYNTIKATSELINSNGVCSLPPLPVGYVGSASAYFDDYLLVCSGYDGGGPSGYPNSCFQLSSSNSNWEQTDPMNVERAYFSLTKAGQELFVMGGDNSKNRYNIDSIEKNSGNGWELLSTKMTSGRTGHCTVYMESKNALVVIGGAVGRKVGYSGTNTVEMLSLENLSWTSLEPLPKKLTGHGCAVIQEAGVENIYVTGGKDGSQVTSNVWKLSKGEWSLSGKMLEARWHHSMGILDGRPVVAGGTGTGGTLTSLEKMDLEGRWTKLTTQLSVDMAKSTHTMTSVPAKKFRC